MTTTPTKPSVPKLGRECFAVADTISDLAHAGGSVAAVHSALLALVAGILDEQHVDVRDESPVCGKLWSSQTSSYTCTLRPGHAGRCDYATPETGERNEPTCHHHRLTIHCPECHPLLKYYGPAPTGPAEPTCGIVGCIKPPRHFGNCSYAEPAQPATPLAPTGGTKGQP